MRKAVETLHSHGDGVVIAPFSRPRFNAAPWHRATIPLGIDSPRQVSVRRLEESLVGVSPDNRRQVTSMHLPFNSTSERVLVRLGAGMICALRHPGGVALSQAHFIATTSSHPLHSVFRTADLDQQIWMALDGVTTRRFDLAPIEVRYRRLMDWFNSQVPVVQIRFEDLVGPKGGGSAEASVACGQRLASFLGLEVDVEQVERSMAGLFGGTTTFRSGDINEWRHSLSKRQLARALAVADQWY